MKHTNVLQPNQRDDNPLSLNRVLLFYGLLAASTWAAAAPEMCRIPAGAFTMGSDSDLPNEMPAHQIYLDAYSIGKTEVTNAEYHEFWLAAGGAASEHTPISYGAEFGTWPDLAETKPDHPVIGVSWHAAAAYAAWRGMRLPTEAEWEKAARGTDARTWPWGNAFAESINGTDRHANTWRDASTQVQPVGTYPTGASPCGAHDMAGNVWEWVGDWYAESFYHRSPDRNPTGPTFGSRRVVKGGSWMNPDTFARCTTRVGQHPAIGTSFIGFRLAKDADPPHEK